MMSAPRQTNRTGVERRRHKRVALLHSATLRDGERTIDCVIRDISVSGVRLEVPHPPGTSRALCLDIADAGRLNGCIVWRRTAEAGFQFIDDPAVVKSRINAAWGPQAAFE
jgi:hypothetical protein